MVHAKLQLAPDILFAVLRAEVVRQIAEKATDIAGRGAKLDSLVKVHDVGALRAPAGGPANADLIFVDIVATLEIIDRAHTVPDFKRRRVASDKN